HARGHGGSGHHGHHADEGFKQHGAVTDEARLTFALDHLGSCAARNERVEAAYGAASDGDEAKRKDLAGKHRAAAVNEARQRRHKNWGAQEENARGKREDGSRLNERAQIVARREQQPHGKRRRREAVSDDGESERESSEGKFARESRRIS